MKRKALYVMLISVALLAAVMLAGCTQKVEEVQQSEISEQPQTSEVVVTGDHAEKIQPVVVEFQLADLYSEADGLFVVPGYPWSEHENPGVSISNDYNVEMPELYDPEPEILFAFRAGDYQLESAPVFSAASRSYVMDITFSSEDVENVPEKTEALVNDLTELFGEPEVQDIHDGGSDDEVYEWAYKWTANSGESKTILSVFSYHTEETNMNYELVLHLQKS